MPENLNKTFKERVANRNGMLLPGAANALTAKIIADLGYEAIYVTVAGVTNMTLGLPDLAFISLTELANHVAYMRDAVELPLVVDADTGFGNPVNVVHTVKVLERSGASALQLEDQVMPKKCGHFAGKEVISCDEMVQKIHAAVDARRDPDFQIVARTDARACMEFDAVADRANAYVEAGADIIFVEALRSVEELEQVPSSIDAPHIVNMVAGGLTPMLPREHYQDMGFTLILYANAALQAAILATQNVLKHLRDSGSLDGALDQLATFEERQRLVSKPQFDAMEQKYVKAVQPS